MVLDNNIVATATDYFKNLDISEDGIDFEETNDPTLISMKEFDLVGEIIALQISFWCLRRAGGICESNNDYIKSMINKKMVEYNIAYKKEFVNDNKDNIW